jgi:hypothetical protein
MSPVELPSDAVGAFDDLAAQFDPDNNKIKGDEFECVCE